MKRLLHIFIVLALFLTTASLFGFKKDEYYLARAQEWLTERYANIDQIYDDLELPETDDLGRVKFTWKSSDLSVISNPIWVVF